MLCLVWNTADSSTIGEAKSLSDGSQVCVIGSVTLLEPAECYIESANRSSGIWVQADMTGFAMGDLVTATGTLGTADGERAIQSATVAAAGGQAAIAPLGMRNAWLGGFATAGGACLRDYFGAGIAGVWRAAAGAPNAGLLVRTTGTVNAVYYSPITDAHWFYIDDGSGVVSDYGDKGIIVYSSADVHQGDQVTVTGVSSAETSLDDAGRLVRTIRPRSAEDVRIVRASE